jgi:hypothetical protein
MSSITAKYKLNTLTINIKVWFKFVGSIIMLVEKLKLGYLEFSTNQSIVSMIDKIHATKRSYFSYFMALSITAK